MTASLHEVALVPGLYVARLVAMLEARGFAGEQVVAGTGVTVTDLADPLCRVSFVTAGRLFENALALAHDPSIGLELGLGLKVSSHGVFGFALMTCNSLGDAIELGERYIRVRGSPWQIQLVIEGDTAIMRFVETATLPARTQLLETVLGAVIRIGEFLLGESFAQPAIEFWYQGPELAHHARFRDQVPRVRYHQPATQALFPASWLARPLALRESFALREAVTALEHERRIVQPGEDLLDRVRAVLANPEQRFPGLEQVASVLAVSSRTLRRHLALRGAVFNALRDDARRARGVLLLDDSSLTIDAIARELGFAHAAGFVRAFQRWTGQSPSAYRKRAR